MQTDYSAQPQLTAAPAYASYYIERAQKYTDLLVALKENQREMVEFIQQIPDDKLDFQYAEGKWTTRSVIGHVIDTERVFQYRALVCSRMDGTALPGYDEDWFAVYAQSDIRSKEDLAREFDIVRSSTIALFEYMNNTMLDFVGSATGSPISARSAGWIIVGHTIHHRGIIEERYFVGSDD